MTGHFTSYKTRPNHELATVAQHALLDRRLDRPKLRGSQVSVLPQPFWRPANDNELGLPASFGHRLYLAVQRGQVKPFCAGRGLSE